MAISKYNAEGYYDPTAYEGMRNVDVFKISYPTGYMEINLEYFFPCTLDKARKVFPLIHRYSSEKDKERLLKFLQGLERYYADLMKEYEGKSQEKFNEARKLLKRTVRNIELFKQGK